MALTKTVIAKFPAALGVPEIKPVWEFTVSPGGKPVAEYPFGLFVAGI